MNAGAAVVYVVDDDPDVLKALAHLLLAAGFPAETFESPERFLQALDPSRPGCLVLDLAMPGLDGLELQSVLQGRGSAVSIVFLTGRGDVASSVRAMKHGAVDFLAKPVDDEVLLSAIRAALAKSADRVRRRVETTRVTTLLAALTEREREVLEQVVAGRRNKQIAGDLGTAEKTIKFHRGNVMRKMDVRTVAELVRLVQAARQTAPPKA